MWSDLQEYSFESLWSPYFFIYILILGVLYFLITGPYRHKFGGKDTDRPSVKEQIWFYTGLLILYILKGSPLDVMIHITLTAHMTQLVIYLFVFPIFIIKGLPKWIWKKIYYAPMIKPAVDLLTNPIIALLLFYGLFSLYHIPAVFNFVNSEPIASTFMSIILLIAAFIVNLPIVSPIEELNKLKPLLKIAYVLASAVLITPACVIIIFAKVPIYASYTNVLDQQLGGVIMKVMQEIVYGFIYTSIFFKWFNQKEVRKIDPLPENVVK